MAQSIYIQITKRGAATGPFTIYWDNFNNVVQENVKASTLDAGYVVSVPDAAEYIVLENMDPCGQNSNFRYIVPISPTPSPSVTPSFSVTPSVSISATPSISVTPSVSITATPSATPSVSITATPSISVTPSVSVTPSISVTPASSVTPSVSVTPSITVTPSVSVTPSITVSVTPSVSISSTPSVSLTPGVSSTPSVSVTPSASVTPSVSITPTRTPSASATPSASVTPSISVTPSSSVTPSVSITRTPSVSISSTPSVSITRTPSVSISSTPSTSISSTPSISISRTPSITPSRSPLLITALYYNNSEFNDGTVFLDGNLAVNQNGSNIINEVFTTPGDVLYTATKIYQDDSIYAQASGNTSSYPKPTFGTSTRRLLVTDSAGNTINDTTVDYNSSTNKTFTVVGGRTYYVRGYTNFSWPTAATLSIGGLYAAGSGFYNFVFDLNTAVDGDFTFTSPSGITADMFFSSGCSGPSEATFGNSSAVTVSKGQYGYGEIPTTEPTYYGFSSYKLNNFVYIDGDYYADGSTFVRGVTTVTVYINRNCQPL